MAFKRSLSIISVCLGILLLAGCAGNKQAAVASKQELYDCWDEAASQLAACNNVTCADAAAKQARQCASRAKPDQAFCKQVPKATAQRAEVVQVSCQSYGVAEQACQQALTLLTNACK